MKPSLLGFRASSPSGCMNLLTRKLSGMSKSTLSTLLLCANRVDARIADHKEKRVLLVEMSYPWVDNRLKKEAEKTEKYGPLRWKLSRRYPGYRIVQLNVIMDALGGWSHDLEAEMKKIFGLCSLDIFKRMQKAVLSGSLNIARIFKVITK